MTDLILHHYDLSPFARKVRAVIGYKGLSWRSCDWAPVPPRPELALLTGGYRRIPVLQHGADIFCDSNMALAALDRLFPDLPIRSEDDVLRVPVSQWFEPRMFTVFSSLRFRTPEDFGPLSDPETIKAFRADRMAFMQPMQDITRNAANVASNADQVIALADWIRNQLNLSGGPFLNGSTPTHADFSLWHPFHWLKGKSAHRDLFADLPWLWAWVDRIEQFGEGERTGSDGADAIRAAASAVPAFKWAHRPGAAGLEPGAKVRVAPSDYGVDASEGELISLSPDHISIQRWTQETGDLALHFPRWGYRVDAV